VASAEITYADDSGQLVMVSGGTFDLSGVKPTLSAESFSFGSGSTVYSGELSDAPYCP
jgi:hypothetical protein